MNLLSLILIAMALIVGACVFYVAWELSSGKFEIGEPAAAEKKEPGDRKSRKIRPALSCGAGELLNPCDAGGLT